VVQILIYSINPCIGECSGYGAGGPILRPRGATKIFGRHYIPNLPLHKLQQIFFNKKINLEDGQAGR
jgi:hypothetical protein